MPLGHVLWVHDILATYSLELFLHWYVSVTYEASGAIVSESAVAVSM